MGREPLNFTSVFLTLTALMPDGLEPPSIVVDQIVQIANRNPTCHICAHYGGQIFVVTDQQLPNLTMDNYLHLADLNGMRTEKFSDKEIDQVKSLYQANSLWGFGGVS